jgi:hypothetical protein
MLSKDSALSTSGKIILTCYSYFNKELRQVFLAITRVSAAKVFHLFLK